MTTLALRCETGSCDNRAVSLGLCRTHYGKQRRQARRLDPSSPRCVVPRCGQPRETREHCNRHYLQLKRDPSRDVRVNIRGYEGRSCLIWFCDNRADARFGLCKSHLNWSSKYQFSTAQAIQVLTSEQPCEICRAPLLPGSLVVDHDHECCPGTRTCGDCTRGFLCAPCNVGLGNFKESLEALEAAATYLRAGMVRL